MMKFSPSSSALFALLATGLPVSLFADGNIVLDSDITELKAGAAEPEQMDACSVASSKVGQNEEITPVNENCQIVPNLELFDSQKYMLSSARSAIG